MMKRVKTYILALVCTMTLVFPSVNVCAEDVEPCASYTICARCNSPGATVSIENRLIDTIPWLCAEGYEHVDYVYQPYVETTCPMCGRFGEYSATYVVEDTCTHVQ